MFKNMNKFKVGALALLGGASSSFAEVTYSEASGFAGAIDLTPYYTAIPLVVTVIGVTIATTLGLTAIKKAR